jgi:hypothetical protein
VLPTDSYAAEENFCLPPEDIGGQNFIRIFKTSMKLIFE